MKVKELDKLKKENKKTLEDTVVKERSELFSLYRENKKKKLKDSRKIFHKRKHIARILTIINSL